MRYFDLFEQFDPSKVVIQFRKVGVHDNRYAFRAVFDGRVICSGEVMKDKSDIFKSEDNGASVQDIVVSDAYRRKGVATKVYNAIEHHLGWKLHPSDEVKPDGQEFWKSRNG